MVPRTTGGTPKAAYLCQSLLTKNETKKCSWGDKLPAPAPAPALLKALAAPMGVMCRKNKVADIAPVAPDVAEGEVEG